MKKLALFVMLGALTVNVNVVTGDDPKNEENGKSTMVVPWEPQQLALAQALIDEDSDERAGEGVWSCTLGCITDFFLGAEVEDEIGKTFPIQ